MKVNKKSEKPTKTIDIKQYSLLIICLLNVVLVLINVIILYLLPQRANAIVQARSEILAQELQSLSAQKLISDLKATEKEKIILDNVLPTKSSLLNIIELFESLNSTVKVQSFTFESEDPKKDENGYAYLPISLVLEGTLSQTMAALQILEHTPYLFSLKQSLIESPNGLSQVVIVRTTLYLYVRQPFIQ